MDTFKVFHRTYWATIKARIVRPYWTFKDGTEVIDGYILKLPSGITIAIAVDKGHIRKCKGGPMI